MKYLFAVLLLVGAAVSAHADVYRLKARFDCWQVPAGASTASAPAWLKTPPAGIAVTAADEKILIRQTSPGGMLPIISAGPGEWLCRSGEGRINQVAPDTFASIYERNN